MKILIAEDDRSTREILKKAIEAEGYEILEAKNGDEAWEIFQKEKKDIHIAILDWIMPEMEGIKLCRRIRKVSLDHYIYILFLTSKRDIEDIVKGLEAGGDDYMTKPFARREIVARVRVAKRFISLEYKLNEANRKLNILATTDSLTGVLNRRQLMARLGDEVLRASRGKKHFCMIMIDIDHFKMVNDTLGHTTGDSILIEITDRIKAELRPYDIIGRYGGEEFLVGIPEVDAETGRKAAERIRASICKKPFQTGYDKGIEITASLGMTSSIPEKGGREEESVLDAMIKKADKALYRAKETGRNKVESY